MQIKKCYAPEKILEGVRESTPILKNALLDGNTLVATDGRIIATYPVERGETDTNGLIPYLAFKRGKEGITKAFSDYEMEVTKKEIRLKGLDGSKTAIESPTGNYPAWKAVADNNPDNYTRVKINVGLLKQALDALGETKSGYLIIGINKDEGYKPVRIAASNGAQAYIMPMREDEGDIR